MQKLLEYLLLPCNTAQFCLQCIVITKSRVKCAVHYIRMSYCFTRLFNWHHIYFVYCIFVVPVLQHKLTAVNLCKKDFCIHTHAHTLVLHHQLHPQTGCQLIDITNRTKWQMFLCLTKDIVYVFKTGFNLYKFLVITHSSSFFEVRTELLTIIQISFGARKLTRNCFCTFGVGSSYVNILA